MNALSKQSERIRWKDGKEQELAEFMKTRLEGGMSITDALKAFAQENGISWLTARWKYYQMQRKREANAAAGTQKNSGRRGPRRQAASDGEEQFIESLQRFIGASRASGVDILPLVKGLARFATLAEEGARLRTRVEETEREKQALLEELKRKRFESGEFEDHLRALLRDIEKWLGQNEVDRIQHLTEFTNGLKQELEYIRQVIEPSA